MDRLFPHRFWSSFLSWRGFLGTIAVFSALLAVLLLIYGYENSFLLTHVSWGYVFDLAMPHFTHLADGATVGGILVILRSRKQPELMLGLMLSLILVLIVVNVLKQQVFTDWDRPPSVFAADQVRELSLGLEKRFSFPSGHSTAAACLGWFIAAVRPGVAWGILSGLFVVFLAWTRVYVGVHFPGDVLAGLLLGTILAMLGTWLIGIWVGKDHSWIEKPWARPVIFACGGILFLGGIISLLIKYYL